MVDERTGFGLYQSCGNRGSKVFNLVASYGYLLPTVFLFMADKSILVCVWLSDLNLSRHHTLL